MMVEYEIRQSNSGESCSCYRMGAISVVCECCVGCGQKYLFYKPGSVHMT